MKKHSNEQYMTEYREFFNEGNLSFNGMTPIEVYEKCKSISTDELANYCIEFDYSMVKDYFFDEGDVISKYCFVNELEGSPHHLLVSHKYENPSTFLPLIKRYWGKQDKEAFYSIIFMLFNDQVGFSDTQEMISAFESQIKGEDW